MYLLKYHLKTLIFIIVATCISLVFLIRYRSTIDTRANSVPPEVLTIIPTIISPSPLEEIAMDSPDGKMTLIMKSQRYENDKEYSFFTSTKPDSTKQLIFTKNETLSNSLSIPYNTWSPNNIFIFVKETTSKVNDYYVFFASGKSFADNLQYLDIQVLFDQKVAGYTITDVTGWAASNLLIVNTKSNDEDKKVSFWFDVKSQKFIKLSTYFD